MNSDFSPGVTREVCDAEANISPKCFKSFILTVINPILVEN